MIDTDHDRGTGRTTAQMKLAPQGAIFVWCNGALDYPKHLAEKYERSDLKIVAPQWLDEGSYRGCELSGIVVDHATIMRGDRYRHYCEACARVRSAGRSA